MMWYGALRIFLCLFSPLLGTVYLCIYIYIILFYLQVEVPPPTIGRTSEEEVVTTSSTGFPYIEEKASGGGVVEEIGQPMQGVQSILSTIPLAT